MIILYVLAPLVSIPPRDTRPLRHPEKQFPSFSFDFSSLFNIIVIGSVNRHTHVPLLKQIVSVEVDVLRT
jgi:hypothetical protein